MHRLVSYAALLKRKRIKVRDCRNNGMFYELDSEYTEEEQSNLLSSVIFSSIDFQMNISYRYTPANSKVGKEEVLHSGINCTTFKQRFSKDDYIFGESENTTFYVYVYDFEPPLWIIISFSQHPKLDLLQFFITFST